MRKSQKKKKKITWTRNKGECLSPIYLQIFGMIGEYCFGWWSLYRSLLMLIFGIFNAVYILFIVFRAQ